MRLTTFALALTACGVAARMYHRSRREARSTALDEAGARAAAADTGLPGAGLARHDDLFSSDSQRGPYAQATGLADFSRGA